MSYSVVRTCRRCGTRAEFDVTAVCEVVRVTSNFMHLLRHPESDLGCPNCLPELRLDPKIDLDEWRSAVFRALNRTDT